MQLNILWTGREYYSLENCLVDFSPAGTIITSTIIGQYEGRLYQVDYAIQTNERGETVFADVLCRHSNHKEHLLLQGDGKGNWTLNGERAEQFAGCIDVDLPLTPFTNTLPIRRLGLQPGATQEIKVVYLDMLERQLRPVRQRYTCVLAEQYHYENVPNDFEATITVDQHGLVIDYPALFVRTNVLEANYCSSHL